MSFLNTLAAEGMNQIPDFNSLDHQISYCGSGRVHGALAFCAGFSFVISLSTALQISQEMFRCVTDHIIKPLLLFWAM
jgi:hypothetical protein